MEKEYSIEYPFSFCIWPPAGQRLTTLETTQNASGYSLKKPSSRDFQMSRQIFLKKVVILFG